MFHTQTLRLQSHYLLLFAAQLCHSRIIRLILMLATDTTSPPIGPSHLLFQEVWLMIGKNVELPCMNCPQSMCLSCLLKLSSPHAHREVECLSRRRRAR
jgi:hypothetical protein